MLRNLINYSCSGRAKITLRAVGRHCAFFAVLVSLCAAPLVRLFAWPLITDEGLRSAWGAPGGDWGKYPYGSNHASFCVGDTKNSSGGCQFKTGVHSDDYGAVGLVAWVITENGGYFCVTQFQCEGKKKPVTWNMAPNGAQKCFWLCKNGYGGNGCMPINESEYSLPSNSPACSKVEISRDDFNSNTIKKSTTHWERLNQENNIALLHNGTVGKREQDVMVGVAGWMDNKKGVIGSPFLFYCANNADSNQIGINFYTGYAAHNLCLSGYTGSNCEMCKPASMCSDYPISQFNAGVHSIKDNGSCSKFECTDTAAGFKSATDRECVACNQDNRYGVDANGVCIQCQTGQIFDKTSKACKQASSLSVLDLQYGIGKTSDIDLIQQCWIKLEPMSYNCCVRGQIWNSDEGKCQD
ncbi:MAG: hypothetical protein LBD50_00055 [Rickettsiales bacterium]|jgi:hypothetical protein|nr:hypothetical protein [Rickettsiales bacterium]